MRLLVTGGAGFIGSNFIRRWLRSSPEDTVINLDLETYAGDRSTLADVEAEHARNYEFHHGDIADAPFVDDLISSRRPDVIVHFAAETHNSRAALDPGAFVRTNVLGTHVLLEAARRSGVSRFHHISTCEVYGDLPLESSESFTEESPYRPRTPYNASKAAADHLVRAYHHTFGLAVTITNCSNNYGPFQHPEKLIPLFITSAIDGRRLTLYEHSANRREWLHVDDHCGALELVVRRGRAGQTYNVGSGDERSIEEIGDAVLAALGKPASLKTYVQDRPGHDRRYLLDHGKISNELGWEPRIQFARGLAETVRWYVEHADWWRPKRSPADVDETGWAARSV